MNAENIKTYSTLLKLGITPSAFLSNFLKIRLADIKLEYFSIYTTDILAGNTICHLMPIASSKKHIYYIVCCEFTDSSDIDIYMNVGSVEHFLSSNLKKLNNSPIDLFVKNISQVNLDESINKLICRTRDESLIQYIFEHANLD